MKRSGRRARLGRVYHCPICGAELSVINAGGAEPHPYCCNEPMEVVELINRVFHCPVCSSEVMVIQEGGGRLEPKCCNRPMIALDAITK